MALLRCAFPWYTEVSPQCLAGSDGEGGVVEGDAEPVSAPGLGGDVVMAAAQVLDEGGIYNNFTDSPMFTLDLLRQFEIRDQRGEYEAYRQAGYKLLFVPTDRLTGLGDWESWWFDRPDIEDDLESWFAGVRANNVWSIARSEVANEVPIVDEPA
jgi:hypothetical protein